MIGKVRKPIMHKKKKSVFFAMEVIKIFSLFAHKKINKKYKYILFIYSIKSLKKYKMTNLFSGIFYRILCTINKTFKLY